MKSRNREINVFNMSALDLFASALGAFILITVVLFQYFPNTGDSPERIAGVKAELEEVKKQKDALEDALKKELQKGLQKKLDKARQNLLACQENNKQLEGGLEQCSAELAKKGLQKGLQKKLDKARNDLLACQKTKNRLEDGLEQCSVELTKKFLLVVITWKTTSDIDLHIVDPEGREFYYKKKEFPGLTPAKHEEDSTRGPGNEIWLHPKATPGVYKVYYLNFENRESRTVVRGSILTPNGKISLKEHVLTIEKSKKLVATITVSADGTIDIRE